MSAVPSILGVVRCIRPWAVDKRALDLRFPTRLGSLSVDVVITAHQDRASEWAIGDHAARQKGIDPPLPASVIAAAMRASKPDAGDYPRAEWSGIDEAHRVPQLTVHHLLLGVSMTSKELAPPRIGVGASVEERLADELRQHVEGWYRTAASWVEVHTAQDLDHESPRFDAWIEGGVLATFAATGSRLNAGGRIVLTTHNEIPASPALLALAFECASTGESPPLPHLLMRDARAAYARRGYRRAVIDAAVAAEVALAGWGTDRGIEIERPSLGKLLRALFEGGALSGKGQARLQSELVKPRNDAVHRGGATSGIEAFTALQAASDVVGEFAPLDLI